MTGIAAYFAENARDALRRMRSAAVQSLRPLRLRPRPEAASAGKIQPPRLKKVSPKKARLMASLALGVAMLAGSMPVSYASQDGHWGKGDGHGFVPEQGLSLGRHHAAGFSGSFGILQPFDFQCLPDRASAVVMDAATGVILYGADAAAPRHPASLSKMMTLYLTFEALKSGVLRLDDELTMSAHAAHQWRTNLNLHPGDKLTVRQAILGIVTHSANDAAVALAERLGGSEAAFARQMTAAARQLGMADTTYVNASGLPDVRQVTTAQDYARLARALIYQEPCYYHFFATKYFDFRGMDYHNYNGLIYRDPTVDGIKPGFIDMSGYNLAASAVRGHRRLIVVAFGGETMNSVENYVERLFGYGFAQPVPQAAPSPPLALAPPPPQPPSQPASGPFAPSPAPRRRLALNSRR